MIAMLEGSVIALARFGFGSVREVSDMDLVSFGLALERVAEINKRENGEQEEPPKTRVAKNERFLEATGQKKG